MRLRNSRQLRLMIAAFGLALLVAVAVAGRQSNQLQHRNPEAGAKIT